MSRLRFNVRSAAPAAIGVLLVAAADTTAPIVFEDIAARAGVQFTLANSATGRKHIIEPMLGGVAVLDYDGDGRQDLYFVNGARIPSLEKDDPAYWNRLYKQAADGRFVDTTREAGVSGVGYSMGIAVADYDNDGFPDMFVSGLNRSVLYRNRGNGTFEDATAKAGLGAPDLQQHWAVAAGWFDYDADGHLDLFVVRYLAWTLESDRVCPSAAATYRIYCDPRYYAGLPNLLFRNHGDGTFQDVSAAAGIAAHVGKGMSAAFSDYDDDGRPDVFVANDTMPNFLFRNEGGGRFREVGLQAGVSVNDRGKPVSSMGIDARDFDNDGRDDVLVTALATETFPLWRNLGGVFEDATHRSRLGVATVARSGWSTGFFDLDNDGWKDIVTANGDVQDNTEVYSSRASRQGNAVLRNDGRGSFTDVSNVAGADIARAGRHRGAAFGDLDGDGRLDVVVSRLNEPAAVFHNVSPDAGHWLRLRLAGRKSNRDGIGARIVVETTEGRRQWNHVTTAVGYVSASEPIVHFGLGAARTARLIEVRWPSGTRQTLRDVAGDRVVTITEPE